MSLRINATVELKKSDIEQIVREYIAKAVPNYEVSDVTFEVEERSHGSGYNDYTEHVFTGVKVSITPSKPDILAALKQ